MYGTMHFTFSLVETLFISCRGYGSYKKAFSLSFHFSAILVEEHVAASLFHRLIAVFLYRILSHHRFVRFLSLFLLLLISYYIKSYRDE